MRKHWLGLTVAALGGVLLAVAPAIAAPFMDGSSAGIQRILDSKENFRGLDATRDLLDSRQIAYWNFGENVPLTIVAEEAAYKDMNTFGIYNEDRKVEIFAGDAGVGDTFHLTTGWIREALGTSTFGFYLVSPEGLFYSDTSRNSDGVQHIVAYEGLNRDLLIGFEDLRGGGDLDFTDFVVRISRSNQGANPAPVPEPGTLLLLGSGIVGLALARRKRK